MASTLTLKEKPQSWGAKQLNIAADRPTLTSVFHSSTSDLTIDFVQLSTHYATVKTKYWIQLFDSTQAASKQRFIQLERQLNPLQHGFLFNFTSLWESWYGFYAPNMTTTESYSGTPFNYSRNFPIQPTNTFSPVDDDSQ